MKGKAEESVFEDTGLKQLKGNLCSKNSQELSLLAGRVGSNISDLCLLLKRWILWRWFDEPSLNLRSTAWRGEPEVLHSYHQCNWVGGVSKRKTQLFQPEKKWSRCWEVKSAEVHDTTKMWWLNIKRQRPRMIGEYWSISWQWPKQWLAWFQV